MSQDTTTSVVFRSTVPPDSGPVPEPDDSLLERLAAGIAIGDSDLNPRTPSHGFTLQSPTPLAQSQPSMIHPQAPQSPTFWIPRPDVMSRLMLGVTLLLLVVVTVLAALVGRSLQANLQQVSDEVLDHHLTLLQQPLPPAAELLDDQLFTNHLQRMPQQQGALHYARAVALMQQHAYRLAADHFQLARLTAAQPASVEQWLQEVDCWLALARWDQAEDQLARLLQRPMSSDIRAAIHARLGRLTLLKQQQQASL